MKQKIYHVILCLILLLPFGVSCIQDKITENKALGENRIKLNLKLSNNAIPVADEVNNEDQVQCVDVFIFSENTDGLQDADKCVYYERVVGESSTGVGLKALKTDFDEGVGYIAYVIANYDGELSDFWNGKKVTEITWLDVKGFYAITPEIYKYPNDKCLLMDGMSEKPTILNDQKDEPVTLEVRLKRAAAKITVHITEFNIPGYNKGNVFEMCLMNYAQGTKIHAANDEYVDMGGDKTKLNSMQDYASFTDHTQDLTVVYSYENNWKDDESLQNRTSLLMNLPIAHTEDGKQVIENNYYTLPINISDNRIERNKHYKIDLVVNMKGSTSPENPKEITDADWQVADWEIKDINIGTDDDYNYLTVNEHNIVFSAESENQELQFTSSDPVEIEITKVYFNNKYGDEIRIEKSGTWESYYPDITPNAEYNGRITINSKVLENNAPKYIEFMVKNGKSEPQTITVVQYPLEYIVNERGFYSYKTSFDGTYEKDPKEYANKNPGSNSYATMSDSYFSAKHASYSGNTSQVYFYSWKSQRQGGSYSWELDDDSKGALHNSRIYHVRITKTSQEYTLGIPKLDSDGYTAAGEENSQMVSPSFMIASHLGYVVTPWGGKISWDYAKKHCKEYVEVAYIGDTDNTIIYDDWRLPTNMEIQIIDKFQPEDGENSTTAIDKILTGMHYWASNGEQETEKGTTSSTGIRCIRDAYIDKTVNNK